MALKKCEYCDCETVITAENMNDIQDAICDLEKSQADHFAAENPHGVTAAQVGARPDTWTPTSEEVGARPATWTPSAEEVGAATPAELNAAVKKAAPRNLLDNSDFRNPVNQRGNGSYSPAGGRVNMIDRWHTWSTALTLTVNTGYIEVGNTSATSSNVQMAQYFQLEAGTKVTFAGCDTDGNIACGTETVGFSERAWDDTGTWGIGIDVESNGTPAIRVYPKPGKTAKLVWVALYEGEYTLETLPEYQSKGYGVELAECQRYFHLYATQTSRPSNGMDCSPVMRLGKVTQGTLSIDGVTHYYNSAEL